MPLKVENLSYKPKGATVALFESLTFELQPGTINAVLGANGAGKSTLLRILAGLNPNHKGTVQYSTKNSTAYLQQECSQSNLPLSLKEFFEISGCHVTHPRFQESLELFQLKDSLYKPFQDLSIGQKRKSMLLRTFALDKEIYILDEPFASLDQSAQKQLMTTLQELKKAGKTVITVAHEHHLNLDGHFDSVIQLKKCCEI